MNIINFGEMSIKNFKSIGEEVSFNYKDFTGMTFVKGENLDIPELRNGVGKSVIFVDALLMVLFGKIANNVNNRDLFHRKATDNIGWIKLQMEVNMQEWNVHCIMTRSRSGGVSLSADIYKGPVGDETNVSKSSKKETLKFLSEEIIKSDADTFRNAVVLSTSNIQNFFQLPKPAKDAYMDSVFTLAAFGFLFDDIKKATNRLKRDLSSQREVLEGIKDQHAGIINKSDAFLKEKNATLETLNVQIKDKAKSIKKLQAEVLDVESIQTKVEKLQSKITKYDNQKVVLSEERKALVNEDNGEISAKVDQLSIEQHKELNEKLKEYDSKIDKIESTKAKVEKVIPVLLDRIEQHNTEITKNELEIEKLLSESKKLSKERGDVCSHITVMMNIKKKFEATYELLCEECQKKTMEHFEFDQEKYDSLEVKNTELTKAEDLCCNSMDDPNDNINRTIDDIAKIQVKVEKAEKGIDIFKEQINAVDDSKKSARDAVELNISEKSRELYEEARKEYQKLVDENVAKREKINDSIEKASAEINKYREVISEAKITDSEIKNSTIILTDLVKRVNDTTAQENPFASLVKDGEKKLKVARETIQDILKDQRKYELLGNIFDENGVKKHIVANIVASLNILIKKYLAEMGTDYTVIFDDKFQYNFYTSTGECDYWSFSSGERRRLDMSVMLALRDILFTNGLVTNVLIVDEVLDSGIDGFALYAVINILKNKTKDSNLGCIIISHRTELQEDLTDTFDREVLVVKENGESKIVTNND